VFSKNQKGGSKGRAESDWKIYSKNLPLNPYQRSFQDNPS